MTRTAGLAALLALTLAACEAPSAPASAPAPTPAAPTPDASTPESPAGESPAGAPVLTGQGYGPLRIGMTLAEVTAAAGPDADPNAVGGADPASCDEFRPSAMPQGLRVMVEAGRLTRISVARTPDLKTDRGFGVGALASEIKAAYGGAIVAEPHKYAPAPAEDLFAWSRGGSTAYVTDPAARGIRYEIGADGRVSMIHVGGPSIQLVEGCS